MNKTTVALLGVIVLGAAAYGVHRMVTKPSESAAVREHTLYSNSELGLEFTYPSGSDGYTIDERLPATPNHVRTLTLIHRSDEDRVQHPPVGGEGPAVIAISVYTNPLKQFPLAWAEQHPQLSNIQLIQGARSEMVVGGANAIGYRADGLYASNNVVVAHGAYMYVFTGQYVDADSDLQRDFQPIVDSVRFIPTGTGANAKININEVCEGALAYMSFPSGAAADEFVAACKEGKHPEVIEQFKRDNGLGDGAAL